MSTRKLIIAALFVAIILVFAIFNIGIIPIPPANVSTMHIPVIIGAMVCGLSTGLVLGAAFGLTSVLIAFGVMGAGPSALVGPLMASSPLLVIVMSVAPRLLIPVTTHFVTKALGKRANDKLAVGVGAVCGSLTNTVGYLGLMLLFYALCGLDSAAVLGTIATVGVLNGSLEAVAAALLSVPIVTALNKLTKKGTV